MPVKLLDCTLRDGGYYNKWDFEPDLVSEYLSVMAEAGVDYVELGFRQFKNDQYLGAHAYTSSRFLNRLVLPAGPIYGVMVDAKTILSSKFSQENGIDELFKDCCDEKIGLVRIAVHFREVEKCFPMLIRLKRKGYLVGLNIMQASLYDSNELAEKAGLISSWSCVDVLYFADSLGSMIEPDVKRVYLAIRQGWDGDIGFHAHNNMGQAISNVNVAVDLGGTWIDGTVSGMGRGAGNAETEYLLDNPKITKGSNLSSVFSLVVNHFEPLKRVHGWGASLSYYLGAKLGLHPTYIQGLCSNQELDKNLLYSILDDLGKVENPQIFSRSTMENVISKIGDAEIIDGIKVDAELEGKEVVLVAQTESSVKYREAILDYTDEKNAILISINIPLDDLDFNYDFVAISHNQKYREEESKYQNKKYRYIAPKTMFFGIDINIAYDYGLNLVPGKFEAFSSYVCVPNKLTLAYAIGFCLAAKVEKISLVGFCGYDSDNPKQKEMQEFLSLLTVQPIELRSLTPTSYAVPEVSIYGL